MRTWFIVLFLLCGCQKAPPQITQTMSALRDRSNWHQIAGFQQEQKWDTRNLHAPSFILSRLRAEIGEGGTLHFRITSFTDKDGDRLSFWWTCQHGTFTSWSNDVRSVSWKAPFFSSDRIVYISAYAADGRGRLARQIITVRVRHVASHQADLIVTNLRYTPVVAPRTGRLPIFYPGESVPLSVDIYNASRKYVINSYIGLWLTTNGVQPSRRPDEDLNIGGLSSGEQKTRRTNFQIPFGTPPGDYTILIFVDWKNSVSESNESDNRQYIRITVAPDGTARR